MGKSTTEFYGSIYSVGTDVDLKNIGQPSKPKAIDIEYIVTLPPQ
jgi:hypothetical protein